MKIDIQPGDFAIVDSKKRAPKLVKYLMRSPTLWIDLFRMATGKLEEPLHYHALLFIDKDTIIEQQGKVQSVSSEKLLNTDNRLFIFRLKSSVDLKEDYLVWEAEDNIGQWYGVMSCIAKTLTWLTGIKFFARYIHIPKTEICINRVCKWYYDVTRELFGKKTYLESTTWSVYKYVIAHPEKFEIVYDDNPREDKLV
jgi:hypothetical protein